MKGVRLRIAGLCGRPAPSRLYLFWNLGGNVLKGMRWGGSRALRSPCTFAFLAVGESCFAGVQVGGGFVGEADDETAGIVDAGCDGLSFGAVDCNKNFFSVDP